MLVARYCRLSGIVRCWPVLLGIDGTYIIHTHVHTYMHTHTHTHTHTNRDSTHMCVHAHTPERCHTHTHTREVSHTHTHQRGVTHTHTHTHTHIHTHTRARAPKRERERLLSMLEGGLLRLRTRWCPYQRGGRTVGGCDFGHRGRGLYSGANPCSALSGSHGCFLCGAGKKKEPSCATVMRWLDAGR